VTCSETEVSEQVYYLLQRYFIHYSLSILQTEVYKTVTFTADILLLPDCTDNSDMGHTRIKTVAHLCLLYICICFGRTAILKADQLHSPTWGYSIDMPSGFTLTYKDTHSAYQFEHELFPLTLVIRSWEQYTPSGEKMKEILTKLNAHGESTDVEWCGKTCTLSFFDMPAQTGLNRGRAACIPTDRGVTLVLCYAPENRFEQLEPLMLSVLDAFSPQSAAPNTSGIITAFAYPARGSRHEHIRMEKTDIPIELDLADSEAHNALIAREYGVLLSFAETPFRDEAWKRYYRMIYRDAYTRLEKTAVSIHKALKAEIDAQDNRAAAKGETGSAASHTERERALAQKLLSWTQTLPYERRLNSSDFTGLIDTLTGTGSDCDSRSLLLAVLMSHMNHKTMLFISPEYAHALFGVDIQGAGARLTESGIAYLLGETTARVNIGMIAQDMSNSTKWFGITGLGL